ncbi:toll/interleukin-1 receptor domain-containing protein [Geodermatophilus maliterrae]|uniref:Toll/interleukin-1 receptor domain-containing protein n=1 Tax=Geodermatophilus maliterrae TaxID=3162531 RepID=A0ABV3X8W5_9ACTN
MTIFLSYARGDEDVVKTMARAFEAARREIWYDHDLDGGDIWWPTILDRIRSCSVFVFALSDRSLESRACLSELDYAEKLDRPILPVLVGPVSTPHANPLATRQFVQFLVDDAVTAFEVLAAADRSAERCPPLPVQLPPEPPIPFAYLRQITHQIEAGPLLPPAQLDVITELRRSLAEETEQSVRQDIVAILRLLFDKPWRTKAAGLEIQATLEALRLVEEETALITGTEQAPGPHPDADPPAPSAEEPAPAPDHGAQEGAGTRPGPEPPPGPGPAPGAPGASEAARPLNADPGSGPDPEDLFLTRVTEINAHRWGPGTHRTAAPDPAETAEDVFTRRTEEVFGQLRTGTAARQARESAPGGGTDDPPPTFPGVSHAEQPSPKTAATDAPGGHTRPGEHDAPADPGGHGQPLGGTARGGPAGTTTTVAGGPVLTAPPTRRALGITGLLLSVGFGALATVVVGTYFVVPFVVSAVTAAVALRFSATVGRRVAAHDLDGARSASHTAMVWAAVALTLVAAVVGIVVLAAVDYARG